MTSLAALTPIHAALEREVVTRITSVLEILCVEQTTVLLGTITWIAVPPLPTPPLPLVILAVAMTGWRCPMDPTEKSFVAPSVRVAIITMDMVITAAPPYQAPLLVVLDQP